MSGRAILVLLLAALTACGPGNTIPSAIAVEDREDALLVEDVLRTRARAICIQSHTDSFPADIDGGALYGSESTAYARLQLRRQPFRLPRSVEETTLIEVFDDQGRHAVYYEPGFRFLMTRAGLSGCYAVEEVAIHPCPAQYCAPDSVFVLMPADEQRD